MFYYTDYIQIHTITIFEDILSMDGAYQDPVTAKLKFTYFEADFNYLYNLLTKDYVYDADNALDAMSAALSTGNKETIDLEEDFIELHTMVFRLTTMVESPDDSKQVGFFIEDGYLLEEGSLSFQQYLQPPSFDGNDRARKVKLLRTYRTMSGHLAALALRYAYYDCQLKAKIQESQAKALASLADEQVFSAAKAAFSYIIIGPGNTITNFDQKS